MLLSIMRSIPGYLIFRRDTENNLSGYLRHLVIAVFVVVIDTRFYFFFAYFIYGGLIFLLMLVLILGKEINGARSWFEFGSLSLQPSEFAKFGTALALAAYLNSKKHDLNRLRIFMTSIAIILLPALLIVYSA